LRHCLAAAIIIWPRPLQSHPLCRRIPIQIVALQTSGVADAVVIADDGKIDAVIDWKSDVDPDPALVELYRGQVRDYLAATKAPKGLIVFLTSGRIEKVAPKP
jgi:hypothetical protein